MKKVLLTLTLAAFAFAANAQFVIGGQIGYNTYGGTDETTNVTGTVTTNFTQPGVIPYGLVNGSTLTIMPKFGYNLNDKMQVGIALGLTWDKIVDYSAWTTEYATIDNFEGWTKTIRKSIDIVPYFRYNLMEFGNFNLFCEAQLRCTFGLNPTIHNYNTAYTVAGVNFDATDEDVEGFKDTYTDITLRVVPGLNYKFNDNFSADLYLNVAALAFNHYTEKAFRDWNVIGGAPAGTPTNTYEDVITTNSFDFEVNMNNDYDITTLFTIGFNYHF